MPFRQMLLSVNPLHIQPALTKFGTCEQHIINLMVYFFGNEYIGLEMRLLGQ